MVLSRVQHMKILQEIYSRLLHKIVQRRQELNNLRFGGDGPAIVGCGVPPQLLNVAHAYKQITEANNQIRAFDAMIDELKNPPTPPEKMTEEDRFSACVGIAVAHKLDISEIVAGASQ
uniref:Uncharacterized protein n=1 Tax=Myoviridae sp. ctshb19 TaxID=2825194 RepID=A0A8S5UGF8_9CAUD|nr:MAG TPA: hypothetical protein [Myoviridae sp. ctshb19]